MTFNIFLFALLVASISLILKVKPQDFIEMAQKRRQTHNENKTMAEIVRDAKRNKKDGYLRRLFRETKEVLRVMDKTETFNALLAVSAILMASGIFAAVMVDNLFLIPVLAAGFGLAPFYYIKITENRFMKLLNDELETTLGIITTSYLRGNNTFLNAVEENLPYLMPPMCHLFEAFAFNVKHVTPNIKEALETLKGGLNNDIFKEWIDAVILCLDNHNLKPTLPPIVSKLSDLRAVSLEMENIMFPPLYEYAMMMLMLIGVVPLLYILNKNWFHILISTGLGKFLLAFGAGAIFMTAASVIRHIKPVTYQ
ncbi:MAG: hypothetical protein FWG91_03835 [Lachnospiraceae bacterium]|nr:hypothetical protein [Lachnospiraceae bacterium]